MKKAPPIYSVPPGHIALSGWNIVILELDGEVYEKFLGHDVQTSEYRISSQIKEYDDDKNVGYTESGFVYQFMDEPGVLHPKAQQIYDYMSNPPTEFTQKVKVSPKYTLY
jgi:hypothetical protein